MTASSVQAPSLTNEPILGYQLKIGRVSGRNPETSWALIALTTAQGNVELNFVLDGPLDSYSLSDVAHLLLPLDMYEQTLELLQERGGVKVSFVTSPTELVTIKGEKGFKITNFNLAGPSITLSKN